NTLFLMGCRDSFTVQVYMPGLSVFKSFDAAYDRGLMLLFGGIRILHFEEHFAWQFLAISAAPVASLIHGTVIQGTYF
ncbi:MAG: hypothetical protein MUE74_12435, partial [Bacteroidales bacterium]|nr:hypothetical protein [Bacteroidales bacterium]